MSECCVCCLGLSVLFSHAILKFEDHHRSPYLIDSFRRSSFLVTRYILQKSGNGGVRAGGYELKRGIFLNCERIIKMTCFMFERPKNLSKFTFEEKSMEKRKGRRKCVYMTIILTHSTEATELLLSNTRIVL